MKTYNEVNDRRVLMETTVVQGDSVSTLKSIPNVGSDHLQYTASIPHPARPALVGVRGVRDVFLPHTKTGNHTGQRGTPIERISQQAKLKHNGTCSRTFSHHQMECT